MTDVFNNIDDGAIKYIKNHNNNKDNNKTTNDIIKDKTTNVAMTTTKTSN